MTYRRKQVAEVFGVSNVILPDSYVDRGDLDSSIGGLLSLPNHVVLRGSPKSAKPWLRQKLIRDAVVRQCRLGKKIVDIYREALGELDIRLHVTETRRNPIPGSLEAPGEMGI